MANPNRMFSNMLQAAVARLKGCSPDAISAKANVTFDGNAFHLESLGIPVTVSWPECSVSPALDPWQTMVLLHYLAGAEGTPLSGRPVTFANLQDGMVRGGGFDRDAEKIIQTKLGFLSPEELQRRCLALGGQLQTSNADLCAEFRFAPNWPVWLKVWFADEEFPASGRLLADASAEHYLSIEDAVTVGGLILNGLQNGI